MKKIALVLVLLLLATAFVVAEQEMRNLDDDTDIGGSDDPLGENTAIAPPPMPTVSESDTAVGTSLVEKPVPKPSVVRKAISRIHLTGSGIAVSEGDAFDFTHSKVVVGAVKVRATAADQTSEPFVSKRLGVLMLDNKKYHLKDIAVSDGEISAEIYGPTTTANAASEPIGEIKIKRFEKPGQDIWAGNLTIGDKSFNIYLLGMKRQFKLGEVTEKVGEYCSDNPSDSRCRNVVSTCAQNTVGCKETITDYCKRNPSDLKCLQLKKLYCLKNASDERCREYLKGLCEGNPRLEHCRVSTAAGKKIVAINAKKVSAITAERGEKAGALVKSKVRRSLEISKNRIEDLDPVTAQEDS